MTQILNVLRAFRARSDDFLGTSPTERAKKCDTNDQRKKDMSQLVRAPKTMSHIDGDSRDRRIFHIRDRSSVFTQKLEARRELD